MLLQIAYQADQSYYNNAAMSSGVCGRRMGRRVGRLTGASHVIPPVIICGLILNIPVFLTMSISVESLSQPSLSADYLGHSAQAERISNQAESISNKFCG